MMPFNPSPNGTVKVSVTTANQNVTLPLAPQSGFYQVRVHNKTTGLVFVQQGGNATLNSMPFEPNVPETMTVDNTLIVGIIGAVAGDVYLTVGSGY